MSKRWILAACVLLCLSGCTGGGVKISVGAVEDVSRMSGASNSDDPALRASATLACYTYEVVG
ncbi:MAG TPA: hypothetical protein VGJ44_02415 [Kribbellaceae bacterium]|jgi:hypothetical protein